MKILKITLKKHFSSVIDEFSQTAMFDISHYTTSKVHINGDFPGFPSIFWEIADPSNITKRSWLDGLRFPAHTSHIP